MNGITTSSSRLCIVLKYYSGWGPFTQQGVRAKEQVNLSIEVPLVPQVPFRGTSSYLGTKLLYGRCRVDYMSHHHHDGGEIPFSPLDDAL